MIGREYIERITPKPYELRINGDYIIRTIDKKLYKLLYDISDHFMSVYHNIWNNEIIFSKKEDEQKQLIQNILWYKVVGFLDIDNDTRYYYMIEGEYHYYKALRIIKWINKINKAINKRDRNEYKINKIDIKDKRGETIYYMII